MQPGFWHTAAKRLPIGAARLCRSRKREAVSSLSARSTAPSRLAFTSIAVARSAGGRILVAEFSLTWHHGIWRGVPAKRTPPVRAAREAEPTVRSEGGVAGPCSAKSAERYRTFIAHLAEVFARSDCPVLLEPRHTASPPGPLTSASMNTRFERTSMDPAKSRADGFRVILPLARLQSRGGRLPWAS